MSMSILESGLMTIFVSKNPKTKKGYLIYGRSDGVLNPGGKETPFSSSARTWRGLGGNDDDDDGS